MGMLKTGAEAPVLVYGAMTTQSVPSHTSMAQAPAEAARIAVPAVLEPMGFTLLDADTTV